MFVHSIDCRVCVKEIDTLYISKLKDIINHRDKCRKCLGCDRLFELKMSLEKTELKSAGEVMWQDREVQKETRPKSYI